MVPMLHSVTRNPATTDETPTRAPVHPLKAQELDTEALAAKYQAERAKRIRDDGITQFKRAQGSLARFKNDVRAAAAPLTREPVTAETKVLIVGAGLAGVVAAVKLIQQGTTNLVIVDKAAGFGGTWYYNQYPGVACDVESYVYLPFLEETGYLPKDRFSSGPEILEHFERVVAKWGLASKAYLQTTIRSIVWDEAIRRWHVHTDHSDRFTAQFVIMATGTLHEPKLPGIPGIEVFQGCQFHSGRWDYNATGDDLVKLADKTVGVVGTGASAVGIVPVVARSVKKLYVFQRTPSTIWLRDNWKTDVAAMAASLTPGWQQARMDQLAAIFQGEELTDVECTAAEGLELLTPRELYREAKAGGVAITPDDIPELMRLADFRRMEAVRQLIEDTVHDRATADRLKPWYSYMCKRPAFHNDYLAAFNRPNVELVDTDGKGVSRLTATGVVANGTEYRVDTLIHATGFDFYLAVGLRERTGIELVGTDGQTLDHKWSREGPATLFGIHARGFPNLFFVGPVQAGVGVTWLHTAYAAGDHIAGVVAQVLLEDNYDVIEPSADAAEDWARQSEEGGDARLQFHQSCSPGYYNNEGKPEASSARWAVYPKGVLEWSRIMKAWREEGSMKGMERR